MIGDRKLNDHCDEKQSKISLSLRIESMDHKQEGIKRKLDLVDFSDLCSTIDKSTKKGPRAPWTSQDMVSAMLLVKQGMSITKAAQSLNIPRTTLRDRITGKVKNAIKVGPQTMLTNQDEKALVNYYKVMQKQGYGKIKEMMIHMAGKLVAKKGYTVNDAFPNETWWQSLCVRNNIPPLTDTHEGYETHKQQVDEAVLNNCYGQLVDALVSNKHDINFLDHPELIYACNENEFDIDQLNNILGLNLHQGINQSENVNHHLDEEVTEIPVPLKVERYSSSSSSGSCSVIACASAVGHSLPPMFVHNSAGPDNQINAPDGILEKVAYKRLEQDFFLLWFHEVFLKNTSRSGPVVLLYDGGNCFVTKETLLAASLNDVIMLCIPATMTHVLQPLDLSLKGCFHESWRNFDMSLLGISSVSHSNFSQVFLAMLNNIVPSSVIIDRFRKVGIYPFARQSSSSLCVDDVNGTDNAKNDESNEVKKDANEMQQTCEVQATYSKGGYANRSIDNNQNFMRCPGIITRPTMSNLNQSVNESPVVTQIIAEDDGYVNDVTDGFHEGISADDVSSSSDEGNAKGVSTNSTSVISQNIALPRVHVENQSPYMRSPPMKINQPSWSSSLTHQNQKTFSHRKHPSSASHMKQPHAANREVILSPTSYRAGSDPVVNSRSTKDSPRPLQSSTSGTLLPPQAQWLKTQQGNSQILASLNALEDLLDNRKLLKFKKAYDMGQETTVDFDPLYPVWKSLRSRTLAPLLNHPKPSASSQETTNSFNDNETSRSPISSKYLPQPNCGCMNTDDYRTIVTPAGNVSVNRNATVIVVMPEGATKPSNDTEASAEVVSARGHDNSSSTHA